MVSRSTHWRATGIPLPLSDPAILTSGFDDMEKSPAVYRIAVLLRKAVPVNKPGVKGPARRGWVVD